MSEIYWITRIGVFHNICEVIMSVSIILIVILLIIKLINSSFDDVEEKTIKIISKAFISSIVILIISGILYCFTPTSKEMLLIYGLGSTVDYIQNNDKAKQLPDKAVDALNRYLDTVAKEENKKE
jgi:hypothetical protein